MLYLIILLAILIFIVFGLLMASIFNPTSRSGNKFTNYSSIFITGYIMLQLYENNLLNSLWALILSDLIISGLLIIVYIKYIK